jgi:hypothetical protein
LWFPDDLVQYDFVTYNGSDYLCEPALIGSNFGDLDCHRYDGGDPALATGVIDLKCSQAAGGVNCDTEYYPSEWEGLSLVTIDLRQYICEDTVLGQECHLWLGFGSPRDATLGLPDYYCNALGCSPNGYP